MFFLIFNKNFNTIKQTVIITKNTFANQISFKKIRSKFLSSLFPFLLIFLAVYVALNAKKYVSVTLEGITLWALCVVPPLFPFFVISSMISESGLPQKASRLLSPVTRILYDADGVAAYCRIISLLSGYPVGVRTIADLKESGVIDSKNAEKYSVFCSTSGPNFIIGFVGVKFGGHGVTLFLVHVLASLLTGVIFGLFTRKNGENPIKSAVMPSKAPKDFGDIVASAVLSILYTGGFVVVFFLFAKILSDTGVLFPAEFLLSGVLGKNAANGLIAGLIECTAGCSLLSREVTPLGFALASAVVSFGGLSVISQSYFYLKKAGAGFKKFFLGKITQSVISFLIAFVIFSIIL